MAKKSLKIGQRVVLTQPLKIMSGVLLPGTELLILKKTKEYYYCSVNKLGVVILKYDLESRIREV